MMVEAAVESKTESPLAPQDPQAPTPTSNPPTLHPDPPPVSAPVPVVITPPHSLSDHIYLHAAAIFQHLHVDKPITQQLIRFGKKTDTPLPEAQDKSSERQAYELAFNTLKYEDLLEDVLIDSCFHTSQQIVEDLLPLAMVMLYDFQDRKFPPWGRSKGKGEEPLQEVKEIKSCLHRCKTKLAASLARCRVKQRLLSISVVLTDHVRTKQRRARTLPLYAWVNTLQSSVEEVCEVLRAEGVCEVGCVSDLEGSSAYCRDPLCSDTLVFPPQLSPLLQDSKLTREHTLTIQDRSVCLAAFVLCPLLSAESDVLVVGSFSALTVAHVAVLAASCSAGVIVCGAEHSPAQREELQKVLEEMDIKNVCVLPEEFRRLDEWDPRIQRLKVVLVLPQCSSSALSNPVEILLSEHGERDLLQDLSKGEGSVSQSRIHTLVTQQTRYLKHALSFPRVQEVVYCTRSVYPEENELLVNKILEKAITHPKRIPFRLRGPVLAQGSRSEGGDRTAEKLFRVEPSEHSNGCFIALLARQADPKKVDSVQDVLARAAAKGLLGGLLNEHAPKQGRQRKARPQAPASQSLTTSSQDPPRLPATELLIGDGPGSSVKPSVWWEEKEGAQEEEEEASGEEEEEGSGEEDDEGNTDTEGDEKVLKEKGTVVQKRKPKQHPISPHRNAKPPKTNPGGRSRNRPDKRPAKPPPRHNRRHKAPKTRTKPRPSRTLTPLNVDCPSTPSTPTLTPDPPTVISQHPTAALSPISVTPKHPPPSPSAPQGNQRPAQLPKQDLGGVGRTYMNRMLSKKGRPNKEAGDPGSPNKVMDQSGSPNKGIRKEEVLKPIDLVLPPISSSSLSSLQSNSGSSLSLRLSASQSRLTPSLPSFSSHHSFSSSSRSVSSTSLGQAKRSARAPRPRPLV